MALKKRLMILCTVIALFAFFGILREAWLMDKTRLYNSAIIDKDFDTAAKLDQSDHGIFAAAYAKQQRAEFKEARELYSSLETHSDQTIRTNVMFNLANSYLQQAATLDIEKEADRAMPLIELAKSGYRQLLSIDPTQWDAKYNLERALQLVPDAGRFMSLKVEGARRAARTVLSADTEDNLP